jgi:hypothetical protein
MIDPSLSGSADFAAGFRFTKKASFARAVRFTRPRFHPVVSFVPNLTACGRDYKPVSDVSPAGRRRDMLFSRH